MWVLAKGMKWVWQQESWKKLKERGVGSTGVLKEAKSQMLNKNSEKAQRDEVSVKQAS